MRTVLTHKEYHAEPVQTTLVFIEQGKRELNLSYGSGRASLRDFFTVEKVLTGEEGKYVNIITLRLNVNGINVNL